MARDIFATLDQLETEAIAERWTDPGRDQAIAEFLAQVTPPVPEPSALVDGRHARPGPIVDTREGG
jgi:hypothetical protein